MDKVRCPSNLTTLPVVTGLPEQPQFWNRLDVHDKRQLELKLEFRPCARDEKSHYRVETFLFTPASLHVDAETYPRDAFYSDIHNYVRLKTPIMGFDELLALQQSPLVKLERKLEGLTPLAEPDVIYQAKLLSCVYRAALRRMSGRVSAHCDLPLTDKLSQSQPLDQDLRSDMFDAEKVLARYRTFTRRLQETRPVVERTRASLRLVDEYMSLSVEQFFRKAAADMERLPRTGTYTELRKELMADVIREETHRKEHQLRSVLSPTGDNEEYMHRIGFLKKFCMNILFLDVRRQRRNTGIEEALFAVAAGFAMAFATAVAFWAQARFAQLSLNFFLVLVVGYMMKDRIKEGLRRIFSAFASKRLFDRQTQILDPVTKRQIGICKEKLDYGGKVPPEISALRHADDFLTVSQGELSESVLRYQKQIILDSEMLPRVHDGISGVTDIIRLSIDHLCRDMDDPEFAIEYVDLEALTVGRVRGAKSYLVDLALRFTVEHEHERQVSVQLYRLVLDRNGIKRMLRVDHDGAPDSPGPVRSVA